MYPSVYRKCRRTLAKKITNRQISCILSSPFVSFFPVREPLEQGLRESLRDVGKMKDYVNGAFPWIRGRLWPGPPFKY